MPSAVDDTERVRGAIRSAADQIDAVADGTLPPNALHLTANSLRNLAAELEQVTAQIAAQAHP